MELEEKLRQLYVKRCRGDEGCKNGMWPFLPLLRAFVLDTRARQVIELGVGSGASTVAFLVGLAETGGWLWSCDINMPEPPISEFDFLQLPTTKLEIVRPKWEFAQGDSIELANRGEPPDICDLLLVDGAFENRYEDLVHYAPRVRNGGCILVHDTNHELVEPQVTRYLNLIQSCRNTHVRLPDNKGMVLIHVL